MKISVFGLGYVGCVTSACLAELGHSVVGVDVNESKVDLLNNGCSPIVEARLDDLVSTMVMGGRLRATRDAAVAVQASDIALISVGTPSRENGSIDTSHVQAVALEIGTALRQRRGYFLVVVRSTVLPGTVTGEVIPILEKASGKVCGRDFGVCMNPEFLREGCSVEDFYRPPKIVIGQVDETAGDLLAAMYIGVAAPVIRTNIPTAEMVKYCDNAFHALKVVFANEIGRLCKQKGIDSHEVMNAFCADTKLNISGLYLRPGFAFGGSCLPKDLRALTFEARSTDVETPLLSSILTSNAQQVANVQKTLLRYGGKRIGFLGLAFKGGTDDLRESPFVALVEFLIGKGFSLKIYDESLQLAKLLGVNKDYIERAVPHIACLMCADAAEVVRSCDVIVVGNKSDEYRAALTAMSAEQVLVDLVRIVEPGEPVPATYVGASW